MFVASNHDVIIRRRWSAEDLRCLEYLAGTLPVGDICRRLQRSERAIRCQMHRLCLSAKVCEGWGVKEIRVHLHLPIRTIRHHLVAGTLRIHSARVCMRRGMPALRASSKPIPVRLPSTIQEFCDVLHWTRKRVAAKAMDGYCRLTHVRITEASIFQLVSGAEFLSDGMQIDPSLQSWIREGR